MYQFYKACGHILRLGYVNGNRILWIGREHVSVVLDLLVPGLGYVYGNKPISVVLNYCCSEPPGIGRRIETITL